MDGICNDLLAEYRALSAFVAPLPAESWQAGTQFFGWSAWDEIAHLLLFDEAGLLAVSDAAAFREHRLAIEREMASGLEISQIARLLYAGMDGVALAGRWDAAFENLVAGLRALDAKARLPWYGPDMSARSFASARLMECWAHGQDIYDALGTTRAPTARLRHIAHLGAVTFAWTFLNRGLQVPDTAPHIELTAPDGGIWTWNAPQDGNFVRGPAEDFCLVVTQRRNIRDTALVARGAAATAWLDIAQCFAGPPADPPAPGARGAR